MNFAIMTGKTLALCVGVLVRFGRTRFRVLQLALIHGESAQSLRVGYGLGFGGLALGSIYEALGLIRRAALLTSSGNPKP